MLLKQPLDPVEPNYLYLLEGPALPPRSGNDAVEIYTGLWQEVEFISLSSGLFDDDLASMRQLRKVRWCITILHSVYNYSTVLLAICLILSHPCLLYREFMKPRMI